MQKSTILLVVVVALMPTGIVISSYGTQLVFEDLSQVQGIVAVGDSLETSTELDPLTSKKGVFAVQVFDLEKNAITVKILDPLENIIISQTIENETFEEEFEVTTAGAYTIIIENGGINEIQINGVIGPEPDAGKKSISFLGTYILLIGLIGIVVIGIYAIKSKIKNTS